LGLAALAAMALAAFLGAGSASATVLCRTTATPCGAGWHVPIGTEVDFKLKTGTSFVDSDTPGNIISTCTTTTLVFKTTNTGSANETVHGEFPPSGMSWGGCDNTTTTISGGLLEVHWVEGTHNGRVTIRNVQVTTVIFGVSCTFGAGTGATLGTLTGGTSPTVDVSALMNKVAGSFLCPVDVTWSGELSFSPAPVYVVRE
jgi:hypothetical protein